MKSLKHIFLWLLLLNAAQLSYAQNKTSGQKNDSYQAKGLRELSINLDNGFTVDVRGENTSTISYSYEFKGNELAYERNFNKAIIKFEQQGSSAEFSIQFPEIEQLRDISWIQKLFGGDSYNFKIENQHLVLTVPEDIKMTLQSRYSDVDIQNIGRDVSVRTRSGSVHAENIGSNLTIDNEYGNNIARSVKGNVRLQSRSSKTNIEKVTGTVYAQSLYSTLTIADISSDVRVENRSGKIDLSNIGGSVNANADYTNINLKDILGPVKVVNKSGSIIATNLPSIIIESEYTQIGVNQITGSNGVNIQNKSGKIEVSDINGPTRISGSYLDVSLSNLAENVHVSNKSGSIRGTNINGDLRIDASYTKLHINKYSGNRISVNNQSSDIFIEATDILSEVSIRNSYGDIELSLDKTYTGNIFLESSYGDIRSDILPDSYTDKGKIFWGSQSDKEIFGQIGNNSSNRLQLITRNGDIVIRKK